MLPHVRHLSPPQGGDSETQLYLDRLVEALESYYYASNAGSWQDPLSRFFNHVCTVFVRRYNRLVTVSGPLSDCSGYC